MRGNSRGRIDSKEIIMMFVVLVLTVSVLGFFYGKVYTTTPEYLTIWGEPFAWHAVAPDLGYSILAFILLMLGIYAKKN